MSVVMSPRKKSLPTPQHHFQPRDLVFAKIKGFPYWPAKVDYPLPDKPTPVGKLHIFFFGTHDMCNLHPRHLLPYEKFKAIHGKERQMPKSFNAGLVEIQEASVACDLLPVQIKAEATEDEIVADVQIEEEDDRVGIKEERDKTKETRRELFGADLYRYLYEMVLGPLQSVPKVESLLDGEEIESLREGEGKGVESDESKSEERRVENERGVRNIGAEIKGGVENKGGVEHKEGVENETVVQNEGGVGLESAVQIAVKQEPVEDDDGEQTSTEICVQTEDHDPSYKGSGDRRKNYKCDKCVYGTNRKDNLNRHYALRHSDKRPFICNICSKDFASSNNLSIHKRCAHTDERPFSCQYCSKRFKTKCNLHDHLMIHMGEKNCICNICQKAFLHRGALTRHKRIHTGEKPYHCHICKYKTNNSSNLSKHVKTHDPVRERPFKCGQCEKTFLSKRECDRHTQTHKL